MIIKGRILIVEDDLGMRETLGDILAEEGYEIMGVESVCLAKKELKERFYNIAIVDLNLPDGTGMELLEEIKKISEETLTIISTGFASVENAVNALNKGAFSYIQKPIHMDEIKIAIKKAIHMQKLSLDNKVLLKQLKELSWQDPLTGLYNQRFFIDRLNSEFMRSRRYVLPLSIVMMDIDFFKTINDVYGHPVGDLILKEFAQCLKEFARGNDIVVRYGGEEFVTLLPDTNKEGALVFSQRLIELIREYIFDPKGLKINIKVSMGLASFPENRVDTMTDLINGADQALHEAKEKGGNRIVVYGSEDKKDTVGSIRTIKEKISKMTSRVEGALVESVHGFAKARESEEHLQDLIVIALKIGRRLHLSKPDLENLEHATILHDLGKVGISNKILLKPRHLTVKEYEQVKKHPQIGAEIIAPIHSLSAVVPMIRFHHERFDGLGYSAGLKGEEIPLGARIIAIIDTYQALISKRPQRKEYSQSEALSIIKQGSGTQFDPQIVRIFLEIMRTRNKNQSIQRS
ncbi:MAG: diguanylate cyclase [Candidatus Omnitrophica bacterium]|nr:diguanylate cyclase [Candidatus Omnitrophota bacterium]